MITPIPADSSPSIYVAEQGNAAAVKKQWEKDGVCWFDHTFTEEVQEYVIGTLLKDGSRDTICATPQGVKVYTTRT